MKTPSAELKRIARENLNGKYGVAILVMITASLIPSACSILCRERPSWRCITKDYLLSGFYYYYCDPAAFDLWPVTTAFKYCNQTTLSVFRYFL